MSCLSYPIFTICIRTWVHRFVVLCEYPCTRFHHISNMLSWYRDDKQTVSAKSGICGHTACWCSSAQSGTHTGVDEQLVQFRGRCSLRQYVPKKDPNMGNLWCQNVLRLETAGVHRQSCRQCCSGHPGAEGSPGGDRGAPGTHRGGRSATYTRTQREEMTVHMSIYSLCSTWAGLSHPDTCALSYSPSLARSLPLSLLTSPHPQQRTWMFHRYLSLSKIKFVETDLVLIYFENTTGWWEG